MNSEKSAGRHKQEPSNGGCAGSSTDANSPPAVTVLTVHQFPSTDESPNHLVYRKVSVPV